MIGCVAIIPCTTGNFIGIKCSKGRGLILPGGGWESDKDPTYHHAAAREAFEETSIKIDHQRLKYLWHGPDGFGYQTIAFLHQGLCDLPSVKLPEGEPTIVTPQDTYASKFAAWYRILFEVCHDQLWPFVQ